MYKKFYEVNYEVLNEYEDIINYLGEKKYKQQKILNNFINDIECRRFNYNKIIYYYNYLTKIFNDIFTMCDTCDYNYYIFKDCVDTVLNILDGLIKISDRDIFDILNKNVYNIENKLISLISILVLHDNEYSLDVRKISGNKNANYKVRYTCSIKYHNKIIFRVYHSCYDNLTTIKLFSKDEKFNNITKEHVEITSEEQLDQILQQYISILFEG